jgi:phage gp36-like protein
MADYVTLEDLETTYGQDLIRRLADHDGDGHADQEVIDKAAADATATINTYLGVRYTLPLVVIPLTVKNLAVDIALYRLAYNRMKQTAEMRLRYEDATKLLVAIAKGDASIGVDTDEDGETDDQAGGAVAKITFHHRV